MLEAFFVLLFIVLYLGNKSFSTEDNLLMKNKIPFFAFWTILKIKLTVKTEKLPLNIWTIEVG